MKPVVFILCCVLLTACGAAVNVDYDKETNFSQYQTYNFYPSIDSGLSELDDKRIMHAVDSLFSQRGFIKSESPQFFVNFFAKEVLTNSRNSIGIGIGGGGGNVGVGVSGGIPIGGRVIEQTLTVDFVDAQNDALFWQAMAEGDYKEKANPDQKTAYYYNLLQKIFSKYPPKK
jgi:hypothetical protein